jgi:hypothetical protein
MKNFWYDDPKDSGTGGFDKFARDALTGSPLLAFERGFIGGSPFVSYHLVAEPDGPVRNAILTVDGGGCAFMHKAVSGSSYGYSVLGDKWTGSIFDATMEGFLGGRIGQATPTTVKKIPVDPMVGASWTVSDHWVVQEKFDRVAYSWDLTESHVAYSPKDDPGYAAGHTTTWGKEIFVQVGGLESSGIVTWNVEQGMRPLLRWPGDHTRGAAGWGTDGTDMVWWYGEGKQPGEEKYPKNSVMTAPFTTDAAVAHATAKRLRSDIGGMSQIPYAVGCGYAVRTTVKAAPLNKALLVVRLSDGAGWVLPGQGGAGLLWHEPLGVTCDEVFLEAGFNYSMRIVRLRFDSLGAPSPPD